MSYKEILGPRYFRLCEAIKEKDDSPADVYKRKNPVRLILAMYRDDPITPLPELGLLCVAPDVIVLAFLMDEGNDVCGE